MELFTVYLDQPLRLRRAVDIARPAEPAGGTALFYVHGGGWQAGNRDLFHPHLEYFSGKGCWCASAGYRLAPGANWQEQLADVMESYDRFLQEIERSGGSVQKIVVLGSSAGAHLASLLAQMNPEEVGIPVRLGGKWRRPDGCVSINGPGTMVEWPDMHAGIRANIEAVIGQAYGDSDEAFAKASPDRYVREGGPAFLFFVVEKEHFFPHEYVHRMSEQIRAAGGQSEVVFMEQTEHGFFYGVGGGRQRQALVHVEAFLERL